MMDVRSVNEMENMFDELFDVLYEDEPFEYDWEGIDDENEEDKLRSS